MPKSQSSVTAVILAAGRGERMKPITDWIPKPLVPVNGTPILVSNIQTLAQCGFQRIVVVYGRPTEVVVDFLSSADLQGVDLHYAFQKEQRGTGDALLTAMNAAPETDNYLLMVGDTVYPGHYVTALWERFLADGLDGCLLLKKLPFALMSKSSLVVLDGAGTISTMVSKPPLSEVRRLKSNLADASLHIYTRDFRDYLSKAPLSRNGEVEVTSALNAWLEEGAKVAGVVMEAPTHVTGLEDFLMHNLQFGGRLIAAQRIEETVSTGGDTDISDYVRMLHLDDLPFAYRRLSKLAERLKDPLKHARVLAVLSEVFRANTNEESAQLAQADETLTKLGDADLISQLEGQVLEGRATPATCHHLAVAYGRRANDTIGRKVFSEAIARIGGDARPRAYRAGVTVKTPARLAFSSSQGSDISYIIEEKSAVILNCAVKVRGQEPGTVTITRLPDYRIELVARNLDTSETLTDFEDLFGNLSKQDPLILLKSGLRFSGIFDPDTPLSLEQWLRECGGGFSVDLHCQLGIGSGLGCSAILAAALIRGLRDFAGLETTDVELLTRGYCCERFYGRSGYQDILGGLTGGIKLIQADASTGLFNPRVDRLSLGQQQLEGLRENLLVFYTGRPHLKTSYLLTIPAKYFMRSGDYMLAYENGKQLTSAMAEALQEGDWERLGHLLGEYWDDREYFEEGVTPDFAQRFRSSLADLTYGTALCGSGHGGYMMAIARPGKRQEILAHLTAEGISGDQVLDLDIADSGIRSEVL